MKFPICIENWRKNIDVKVKGLRNKKLKVALKLLQKMAKRLNMYQNSAGA